MMSVKYIFFDLDGTIGNPGERDKYIMLFTDLFIKTIQEEIKLPTSALLNHIISSLDEIRSNPPLSRTVLDTFTDKMSLRLHITYSKFASIIDRFYQTRFFELEKIYFPAEGARELISKLQSNELILGVATDPVTKKVAVQWRLKWANLSDINFSVISNGEEFHAAKPHTKFFEELLSKAGAEPSNSLFIGDSYSQDIVGAKKIGMQTILVSNENKEEFDNDLAPDFIVPTIKKIPKILKKSFNIDI